RRHRQPAGVRAAGVVPAPPPVRAPLRPGGPRALRGRPGGVRGGPLDHHVRLHPVDQRRGGLRHRHAQLDPRPRPREGHDVILDRFRLTDRAAVVTGAGRGIGAATAVALAEAGADVLVAARTEQQLAAVAERIEAAGRRAVVVPADPSDPDAAPGLAEAAADAFGRLDVVVNNVGGWMPRELTRTEARHLEAAFRFNVSTAHAVTRAAVPLMLASPRPDGEAAAVVNVSSAIGSAAGRGYVAYGTAKAALSHWTRLAARDLAPRVRVNAVAVGAVATSALALVTEDEATRRGLKQATPLRRIGDPDEVAAAILFLASPASSYLTGQVVGVDGGLDHPSLDPGYPDL